MRQPAVDGAEDGHAVMGRQAEGVDGDDGQDQADQRPGKPVVDALGRATITRQDADGDADRPAVGVAELGR